MKKATALRINLTLHLITGGLISLSAQIPNASFENWTSGAPNGWRVTSNPALTTVTRSNNGYADTNALRLNVVSLGGGYTAGGSVKSGGKSVFFADTGNFLSLSGWYILHMADSSDELYISVGAKCGDGTLNGSGMLNCFIDSNTAVYKQFIVPVEYYNWCTADSATITMEVTNFSTYKPDTNSYAIIDELSLGAISGYLPLGNQVNIENVYPVPANEKCNIVYTLPVASLVSAYLFDVSGRKILELLNPAHQTPGRYRITFNVSGLANGVYISRIMADGQVYIQKVIVERN